jgi:LuxR family maltose regulon positive regulatory protein
MSAAYLVYEGVAFNYLVYGKAMMASKRYAELEVKAAQFDGYFSEYSNQLGLIHNGIFKAAAAFHLSGMTAGVPLLQKVLEEAAQDQIIMPFVEAAPHISEMLLSISSHYPDQKFIQSIISLSSKYTNNLRSIHFNPVPLSPREIKILSLLDEGLSRKQIAEKLFISQETAKTHMKNIYQKLEVNSKVSAINIAKMHGYLSSSQKSVDT